MTTNSLATAFVSLCRKESQMSYPVKEHTPIVIAGGWVKTVEFSR
jgi:hypothetical protein